MEESNNLTPRFERIDEDNQFHYMLTYTPRNTVFDGRFREIQVKSKRPDTGCSRAGYREPRAPFDGHARATRYPRWHS